MDDDDDDEDDYDDDDDDDNDDDDDEKEPTKTSTPYGMHLPDEVKEPTEDSETNPTMEWTFEGRPIKVEIEEEPTDESGTNQGEPISEVNQEAAKLPQSQPHPPSTRHNLPTFVNVTEDEKALMKSKHKSKNTVKKVKSSVRQFQRWLAEPPRCNEREIFHIMPPELDDYIGTFLLSIRKADESDYEPDSLTSYHRGIDRYLKDNEYPYSIIKDMEFETSRQLLASKRKELIRQGKGNRPNAVGPVRVEDRARLLEKDVIGLDSPIKLLNLLWLNNTVLFGVKGAIENHRLRWGDVKLKLNDDGREYLEYNERLTQARTGANTDFPSYNPIQFSHASLDTCPVHAYKVFSVHRPNDMCEPTSPFYLAINHKRMPGSDRWYKSQPLGQNSLNSLTKKMAAGSCL